MSLLAFAGCSRSTPPTAAPTGAPLKEYASFYEEFLRTHKNQPPANEQEFRAFLETKQDQLAAAGLSMESMFQSPRDGAPLTWVYGRKPPVGGYGETYVAYETTPVDGKTLVVGLHGTQVQMDDAWFRRVFPQAR
jgi:hypothetical protein